MAVGKSSAQVEWAGADSKAVTAGSSETSDAVTVPTAAQEMSVILKVDHSGTPVSGDDTTFRLLANLGDPDADPDSADEFTTVGNSEFLATIDSTIEDPALRCRFHLSAAAKEVKIVAENDGGSTVTVSAQFYFTTG